jgi:hypothetical protein
LLGIEGFADIRFRLMGSIPVDIVGVRRVSIVALSVALVGRSLLAFGGTKFTLYLAMFLFKLLMDGEMVYPRVGMVFELAFFYCHLLTLV